MFNSRFSLTPFSLRAEEEFDLEISVSFSDSLKNVSGFGVSIIVSQNMYDSLMNYTKSIASIIAEFSSSDSLKGTFDGFVGIVLDFNELSNLSSKSSIIKNIEHNQKIEESLESKCYMSKDMFIGQGNAGVIFFDEKFLYSIAISKDLVYNLIVTDLLSCDVTSVILENEKITINATIPANGRLEIDSDDFTVLLNGENALHLHSGEWLFLDREIESILIDSGTGGELTGSVIYNERYL